MRMYMSGTPRNDPYQPVENRLCTHRLFSMHGEYEKAVMRWLKDVKDGIFTAEAYFQKNPQHKDHIIKRDLARRVNQDNFEKHGLRKKVDWDTAQVIEHVCQTTQSTAPYPRHILLDSGAFTAWNKGEHVTVEEVKRKYGRFIELADGLFDEIWMINLDKIPGERGRDPTPAELDEAVKISDVNFEILTKTFGNWVQPVFHQGESDMRLRECVDQVADGSGYLCVSPRNDLPEGMRVVWSNEAHQKIAEYKPNIRTHGLATTGNRMIREVPWYSGDSAAWVQHGGYGMVDILHIDRHGVVPGRDPRYKNYFLTLDGVVIDFSHLSDEQLAVANAGGEIPGARLIGGKIGEVAKHYDACRPADQQTIDRRIERFGFSHEIARWDSRVRNLICMGELQAYADWASTIEKRHGTVLLFGDE